VPHRSRTTFPLVPRHRLAGLPFGVARSVRRGRGSDLAGSRPYAPGDPISTIDWRASARLSTARGDDEFIVRERFAEEAPQVVVLCDRRASMALYPRDSPWLSKPPAARTAAETIVQSGIAAHGAVGYLDYAGSAGRDGDPFWLSPQARSPWDLIDDRQRSSDYDAAADSLARGLEFLARARRTLAAGTFVFVISDFVDPPPAAAWLGAEGRRWELVPVVIQDPTWEQSFPLLGPLLVPFADPQTGGLLEVRMTRREMRAWRARREQARKELLSSFASLDLDPVLLDTSEPEAVQDAFLEWAERRRATRNRR
jgi:uncharacterized protein (DUF58 family)